MSEFKTVAEDYPSPGDKGILRGHSLGESIDVRAICAFNPYICRSPICWHYFHPDDSTTEYWRSVWLTDVWKREEMNYPINCIVPDSSNVICIWSEEGDVHIVEVKQTETGTRVKIEISPKGSLELPELGGK